MTKEIIFATHNLHKVSEVQAMLAPLGIKVLSGHDVNLPDVEETGETFIENALLKARAGFEVLHKPVLAEDTGLCIDALNGLPGVRTKRFAEENGGFPAIFDVVNTQMGDKERSAHFCCVMAYVDENGQDVVFIGSMNGEISKTPAGSNGFGYDPVFIPTGYDKTVAELPESVKNSISHRHNALVQVVKYLESQ